MTKQSDLKKYIDMDKSTWLHQDIECKSAEVLLVFSVAQFIHTKI